MINLVEILERGDGYANLIKDGEILVDIQDVEKFKQISVSIFSVDKRKFCWFTKDTVIKSLTSAVILSLPIMKAYLCEIDCD